MHILASCWGALGLIFKQLRRPFRSSRVLRQTIEKHSSKSLVKRSCVGLACVWRQNTQPRRGISRFLRPKPLSLRIQLASQTCFFIRRNSKTLGFYVVPRFPSLFWTPRGSPRPEIARKCCSKSLVKSSFDTAAGQKRTRTLARWPVWGR